MSRQQMIDTYFWDDPWVQKLKPLQRYYFLYLLTGPLTNICGVYEITDGRIQRDTGLSEADLKKFSRQFEDDGKAFRFRDFVIMRNWPKRQNIKSPQVQKAFERILMALPLDVLEYMAKIGYQYPQLGAIISIRKAINPATKPAEPETELSTSYPQAEEQIPHTDGIKPSLVPYPYGIDTQSHLTTPHFTTLHSTETEKNPELNRTLGKLLKTMTIQETGK